MSITLNLPTELAERMAQAAAELGISLPDYMLRVLSQSVPTHDRRDDLVALLQTWIDADDVADQVATSEFLIEALDQDRLSSRPLYPPEMEGVTW